MVFVNGCHFLGTLAQHEGRNLYWRDDLKCWCIEILSTLFYADVVCPD